MTVQELRVFLQGWFCGCGAPDQAAAALRDLLAIHPLYDHRDEVPVLLPERLEYLVLYTLDHFKLTEHGGSVGGAWLTDKGKAVLEALQTYGPDAAVVQSCSHGYAVDTPELKDCPECGPMNR